MRKALGAPPVNIMTAIVAESLLVTVTAGYIGLVASVGLLELYNLAAAKGGLSLPYFSSPQVDIGIAFSALGILVGIGALAGLVPAWHAAAISPIEAMREE